MGLVLIADDLTGALDSAAPFSATLGPLPVMFKRRDGAKHAVHVIPTRDSSAGEAEAMTEAGLPLFRDASPAFKKIDSLMRGHWAMELARIMRSGLFETTLLAPAFPKQGRVTRSGVQFLRHDDGILTQQGGDIAAGLGERGLSVTKLVPGRAIPSKKTDVLLFDAATDEDLKRIVAAGRAWGGRILWCGSAGLAGALAEKQAVVVDTFPPPMLALVGSHHPVMRAQIDGFRRRRPGTQVVVGDAVRRHAAEIERMLADRQQALVTFEMSCLAPSELAAVLRGRIGRLVRRLPRPGTLFASGGETLLSICKAAGVERLTVHGEVFRGVPASRIEGGVWDGAHVVSKSGAFGASDMLIDFLGG